jgi:uncharacterized protein YyaL (SSP411 family)
MTFISAPAIANVHAAAPVLLAGADMAHEPVHIAVVGPLDSPAAQRLHRAALSSGLNTVRIDWLDPRQGPALRDDIAYPALAQPAAFFCANGACSSPVGDPEKLRALITARTVAKPAADPLKIDVFK